MFPFWLQSRNISLHGIISSGQSLSVGVSSSGAISTTQPYMNVMLWDTTATYDITDPTAATLQLNPLVAPSHYNAGTSSPNAPFYPNNEYGENIDVSVANTLTFLNGNRYVTTSTGASGVGSSGIEKGGSTDAYAAGIYEATAINRLAALIGNTYLVEFSLLTHGEGDYSDAEGQYLTFLEGYQSDVQTDVSAITGQTAPIPLFLSQENGVMNLTPQTTTSCQDQYLSEIYNPGVIYVTSPKYQYTYIPGGTHLVSSAYILAGEKTAQAFHRKQTGQGWQSLHLGNAIVSGSTITATFTLPIGSPLQWTTSNVGPHQSPLFLSSVWANGNGFEVWDTHGITITSISGDPSVITFTSTTGWTFPVGGCVVGMQNAYMNPGNPSVFGLWGSWNATYVSDNSFSLTGSLTGQGTYVGPVGTTNNDVLIYYPITSVSIVGTDQVQVNFSASRVNGGNTSNTYDHLGFSYAMTPDVDNTARSVGGIGTAVYAGGLLQDGDTFAGPSGTPQPNYCVAFWNQIT